MVGCYLHGFISHLRALSAPGTASSTAKHFREKCPQLRRSPDSSILPHALASNNGRHLATHQIPKSGVIFFRSKPFAPRHWEHHRLAHESTKNPLVFVATCDCCCIFSKQDCASHGRSNREGFAVSVPAAGVRRG